MCVHVLLTLVYETRSDLGSVFYRFMKYNFDVMDLFLQIRALLLRIIKN